MNNINLLTGSIYALANAASLLEDAALLFSHNRYSRCFVLTVIAREELGRHQILADKAFRKPNADFDPKELRRQLVKHTEKLARGQSIVSIPVSDSQKNIFSNPLLRDKGLEDILSLIEQNRESAVQDLHARRLRALYVDPGDDGRWNIPDKITREEAQALLHIVVAECSNAMIALNDSSRLAKAVGALDVLPPIPSMFDFTARVFPLIFGEAAV